jgi:hypothetical protein
MNRQYAWESKELTGGIDLDATVEVAAPHHLKSFSKKRNIRIR